MGARILFFESDARLAQTVRDRLAARGVGVDIVEDGAEGIDLAIASPPALILLTIELPKMNGFLVCKKLKKTEETQSIPIIILSSDSTEEVFEQHRKLRTRAEEYLRKPVEVSHLLSTISAYVPLSAPPAGWAEPSGELLGGDAATHDGSEPGDLDELSADGGAAPETTAVGVSSSEARPSLRAGPRESMEEERALTQARRVGSMPPPPMSADLDGLRADLARARADAEAAGAQVRQLRADSARLEKEVSEARSRAVKGGAASSRELLDLREALNGKDKENLELRDQVSARDKQLIELRDKNLQLERAHADYEDRILALERAQADAQDQLEVLSSDKDSANKRAEDLKGRLERSDAKARKLEEELEQQREQHVENLKDALDSLRAELIRAHEADRAEASARHAEQVDSLRRETEELQASLESLGRSLELERQARQDEQEASRAEAHEKAAQIGSLEAEAREREGRVSTLEAEARGLSEQVAALEEGNASLAREKTDLEARRSADAEMVERVRRALAIGVALLSRDAEEPRPAD